MHIKDEMKDTFHEIRKSSRDQTSFVSSHKTSLYSPLLLFLCVCVFFFGRAHSSESLFCCLHWIIQYIIYRQSFLFSTCYVFHLKCWRHTANFLPLKRQEKKILAPDFNSTAMVWLHTIHNTQSQQNEIYW